MNLPSDESYSRAPMLVSPVRASIVPPTKPFSPGQVPLARPRSSP